MVKKSKKSKSKRKSLKDKHKIIRKVKEHHRKKAKEAKKLGLNKRKKVEKDPGIPSEWPFKEQELKNLEIRRARHKEELKQKKAANKERARKRKLGILDENVTMEETDVPKDFVKNKDNSDRVFYKELVKVIDLSDVIVEVLDARDPLGTRCVDIEKMVLNSGPNKKLILLLNKIDLVPREAVEKWLKYLREELPAVAFKCSTQEQKSNLSWKSSKASDKPSNILQTSDCLGADTLIKLLKNYSRSHEIKKSITVGIVGLPNVGKSSLINSLKRSHVVNVGGTPGLTRSMQEVQLDKSVKLLDCPGVVMLKSGQNDTSITLRNCKRIEKLEDPVGPVNEILKLCPAKFLVMLYKITSFDTVDDFLQKIAIVRGKLKKGGIVDVVAAARIVLYDWNEGKIPFYTMPPIRNEGDVLESEEAKIVSELGKEFNIVEVYGTESSFIGSLKSVNEFSSVEVPPNCPLNFDEQMLEEDPQDAPIVGNDEIDNNDEDESMEAEEEETGKIKAESATTKQNEKLYDAEGMLNTKLKKAENKRRKKTSKAAASGDAMEDDNDSDYDFKVDFKQNSSMTADEDHKDDIKAEVPMAVVN